MRNNRRWKMGWVAVAIATAGLLGSNGLASGSVATSTLNDGGLLHLHFGSDGNRFFHEAPSGGASAGTQGIYTSGCGITVGTHPGDAALATAAATGPQNPSVGAESGGNATIGLGVKVKGGNGANCGQVNPGETLSVKLGSALTSLGLLADKAELDIDAKYSVTVRVQFKLNGVVKKTQDFPTTGSDSGPDSTSNDNFAIALSGALFDEIVLSPVVPAGGNANGAFSLEGGRVGDPRIAGAGGLRTSAGTYDTLIHLIEVDGLLDCTGPNATAIDSGSGIDTTLVRSPNIGGSDCVLIPYDLDLSPKQVALHKDLLNQTGVNFSWTVTWAPELPPITTTQINYGAGFHDIVWCDGSPSAPIVPTGEFWCFTARSETLVGPNGEVQQTETLYGAGDPVIGKR